MDERERLIDLMRRVHDGDAWHGPSVRDAIAGVDSRTARSRPTGAAHSIWDIALHIDAWRREVCARLKGKRPSMPHPADWPAAPEDDAQWARIGETLDTSHHALLDAVRAMSPESLDALVAGPREPGLGTGVTFYTMVHGVVHHDAYHAGQIALLKRLHG